MVEKETKKEKLKPLPYCVKELPTEEVRIAEIEEGQELTLETVEESITQLRRDVTKILEALTNP